MPTSTSRSQSKLTPRPQSKPTAPPKANPRSKSASPPLTDPSQITFQQITIDRNCPEPGSSSGSFVAQFFLPNRRKPYTIHTGHYLLALSEYKYLRSHPTYAELWFQNFPSAADAASFAEQLTLLAAYRQLILR